MLNSVFSDYRGRGGVGGGFDQSRGGFNDQPVGESEVAGFQTEQTDAIPRSDDFGYGGGEDRGYRGIRRGGRGGGMGYGGGRGRGYYENGSGRGRQFDRMSGSDRTGVKAVDKREGRGGFNWGTPADQLEGENEGLNATAQSGDETQLVEGEGKIGLVLEFFDYLRSYFIEDFLF